VFLDSVGGVDEFGDRRRRLEVRDPLLHAEGELDKRAGDAGPLSRPANGDAQALQRFEREIAKIVAAALRDAGPLR